MRRFVVGGVIAHAAPAQAGNFIQIPWWIIHGYGLLVSLPGLVLSVFLARRLTRSRTVLVVFLIAELVVVPWFAIRLADIVTPGIHARADGYAGWEHMLRVSAPGSLVPLILVLVLWGCLVVGRRLKFRSR